MTHPDMTDRPDLGIFVQRAHPEHDNVGFRGHVGVDMRTTVRTKTAFLAGEDSYSLILSLPLTIRKPSREVAALEP